MADIDLSLDITKDLPSLQFESALDEEEKEYLPLRARSHAQLVYACAHAIYLVRCVNQLR